MDRLYLLVFFSSAINLVKPTENTDIDEMLLQNIGKSILTRAINDPSVMSLNIITLMIVFMIKSIMYGAALLGTNYPDTPHKSRTLDDHWITDPEILLLLGYILWENEGASNILQVACCHPKKTQQYLNIAKVVMNVFAYSHSTVEVNHYRTKVVDIQKAIDIGLADDTACTNICINML